MALPLWKASEFEGARRHGGKRNPFSGVRSGDPGDFSAGLFRFENKFTEKRSYSITSTTWEKINEEARFDGYLPGMVLQLQDTPRLVICEEDDFIALNEELEGYRAMGERYMSVKPKIDKSNRAALRVDEDSNYFQPIRDFWLRRQSDGKKNFKGWNGNISPSAKLSFSMCIEKFFNEQVQNYLEFMPDTLMSVNMGTLVHRGFEGEVIQVPDFLYPFPDYATD